jgi:hypothetical protein
MFKSTSQVNFPFGSVATCQILRRLLRQLSKNTSILVSFCLLIINTTVLTILLDQISIKLNLSIFPLLLIELDHRYRRTAIKMLPLSDIGSAVFKQNNIFLRKKVVVETMKYSPINYEKTPDVCLLEIQPNQLKFVQNFTKILFFPRKFSQTFIAKSDNKNKNFS